MILLVTFFNTGVLLTALLFFLIRRWLNEPLTIRLDELEHADQVLIDLESWLEMSKLRAASAHEDGYETAAGQYIALDETLDMLKELSRQQRG